MFCHVLKRLQVLVDLGQEVHSVGTVLGVFILAMVEIGLIDALIPNFWFKATVGLIIVGPVTQLTPSVKGAA